MNIEMPRELSAEKSAISGMMQSTSYLWNALSVLKAEYFYDIIFRACFEAMAKNKSADFPMIENVCSGTSFDPMDLFDTNHSVSGKTEIDLIVAAHKKRIGIETCYAAVNSLLSASNENPTETISETISKLSQSNVGQCSDVKVIGELLPQEIERIKRISNGEKSAFIETGISDIDRLVCIEREDYIPLGGRPSNCKSVLASQICRNLAKQGRTSLYFCLDSSRASEVSRVVFAEAGVDLQRFNRGINAKSDFDRLSLAFDAVSKFPMYMDNTRKITTDMIYAQSQRVKSLAGSLDLIVIDFMQNVKHQAKDIRERVSLISEELHFLPSEIHCPVMPLSQLSRYMNEESQAPTLKNLKESGDIEEDADKVFMVWFPSKYPCNKDKKEYKNLLELYIEKNKNGTTGKIPLTVDAATFSIYNRTKPETEEDQYAVFRG